MKRAKELSLDNIIQKIDGLKAEVEKLRPLAPDLEGRVMQKFRLHWNYHSNAIEGNTLTYGETTAFLMEGITAKGKPLKDYLDIRGHNEAIDYLLDTVKSDRDFTESDIRSLHKMILVEPYESEARTPDGKKTKKLIKLGVYKSSPNHVITGTGETHYYASPEETPIKMKELMEWYNSAKEDTDIHPLVLATVFRLRNR
ncbi:MAG: hypothetical protein GY754_41160 [bacterium]|nr:hypothetical protein [bacterium]